MPNMSTNTIAVKGKKSDVIHWLNTGLQETKAAADMTEKDIAIILYDTQLTLDSFNPTPETPDKHGATPLECWRIEGQGDELIVFTSCETAWIYPDSWLETMQLHYPNLTFFCRAREEFGEYNGFLCARDPEVWIDHYPNEWERARDVVKAQREAAGEEFNEEEECDAIEDAVVFLNFKMDDRFEEYIRNYHLEDHI